MHCPRCGVQNDDTHAACWNCFAQLSASVGVKIDKKAEAKAPKPPKPEKPAKAKKAKKGEAVVDTVPEPLIVPEPVAEAVAPVAAAVVASAPIELDAVPTEIVAASMPEEAPAPFDIPTITASAEPETPVAEEDQIFIAGIPMGDDTDATPNNARVMDLDAPVDDSSFIIPGLADESPDKPLGEDVEEMDDLGPMAFDLDSEEPGKKPEGKNG